MTTVLLLLTLVPSAAGVCSIGTAILRDSGETLVLASWTGELRRVPVPATIDDLSRPPGPVRDVRAFVFRVAEATGPELLEPGTSLIVVPWAYDSSCRWVVWNSDEWLPANRPALLRLRNVDRDSTGVGLANVLGWHTPYPYARFLGGNTPVEQERREAEWLRADEYYSLLKALPLWDPGRPGWLQDVERVFAQDSLRWQSVPPGPSILKATRCAVAGAQCGS